MDTTYIADLPPENITYHLTGVETKVKKEPIQSATYTPLDVHKNPYLASESGDEGGGGGMMSYPKVTSLKPQPQHPLPSRDIPQKTDVFQDIEARPNYLPKEKLTRDFVRENDEWTEKKLLNRKKRKQRERIWRISWEELNTPILLAVLFFLFQQPWLHNWMYKYLTFLPLFHSDGIMNVYGMMAKAVIFAVVYYIFTKMTDLAALPRNNTEEDEDDA
jgi:hypothetical protein